MGTRQPAPPKPTPDRPPPPPSHEPESEAVKTEKINKLRNELKSEVAFMKRIASARFKAKMRGYDPDEKVSVELLSTGEQKHVPVWCWYLEK